MLGITSCASFLSPLALSTLMQIPCFFIFNNSGVMIYLLVYVDDIIIIGDNNDVV